MSAAWFIDGAYLFNVWSSLQRQDQLDFSRLRKLLEDEYCDSKTDERIEESYYFGAESDLPTARQSAFHAALSYPPPGGPGIRVKLYWLKRRHLWWPANMGGQQVVHPVTGVPYELVQEKAVDVGLATHLMRSHAKCRWQKLFLAAGDSDFYEPVIQLVENENVRLVLIGSPQSISPDLQPYAHKILAINEVAHTISRPRPPRS